MTLWYIHQYYRTPEEGGAIRSFHLANALVGEGHEVVVLTAHDGSEIVTTQRGQLTVVYFPVEYRQSMGIFARARAFWGFVKAVLLWAGSQPVPDAIYATSTPLSVGYIAYQLRKTFSVPYIFEIRDLWPKVPLQMLPWLRPIGPALRFWEKRIYRNATALVTLSSPMADHVKQYAPGKPLVTITNFSDTGLFSPSADVSAWRTRWDIPTGHLTVVYTGVMGKANAPDTLCKYVETSHRQQLPISWVFLVDGPYVSTLKEQQKANGWENLQVQALQNKERVADLLSGADISLVTFDPKPSVLGSNSPNKMFDALAAGCMVISNRDGWYTDALTQAGAGRMLLPEDLATWLPSILKDPSMLQGQKARARTLAVDVYNMDSLVERWLTFIHQHI